MIERLSKLRDEQQQRATLLFEAYHQAIGATNGYNSLIATLTEEEAQGKEDTAAEALIEPLKKGGKNGDK
jgi:hypothetical protein